MGDALGVAGSAVGIVSLGLQLCQGLVTYINAIKGRKEEIQDSVQEVQRVEVLLKNIKDVLPQLGSTRELNIAIDQKLQLISQEAATNATNQSDQLEALRVQGQQNSDSLTSIVSSSHEFSKVQFRQTQWLVRDNDQKVHGRLKMMDTSLSSIARDSGVTVAKIEDITQILSSHSESLANMGMTVSQIQRHTHARNISQSYATNSAALGNTLLSEQGPVMDLPSICDCASTLPTSRFSYSFWHLKFDLEVQEQHHRGCELFGIHRNKKRKVAARFPLKVAWFSARMTLACLEYTSGTSTPGYSVRYKNIVPSEHSPVIQTIFEIYGWDRLMPGTRMVQEMESMERRIVSMYRDAVASPYDRDVDDLSHAEVR
ncbi:hypothetical protein HYE67_000308 [Fusarium culmorum]|uniref:Fungal N-terminal domain-containing protein n=1 Tax=Fusarium culmorum TaxID=5516 RepID=A0A7S8HR20_FUSCU|nr:hypothetical protein HYE67_000308 [Fusarium culmorum]